MDEGLPDPFCAEKVLDAHIYKYLISHNMIATAQAFVKETQDTPSAPDPRQLSIPEGVLSDWWSIFWHYFSFSPSPGDLEQPDGYAPEEKTLEVGDHFSPEEQMQQRATTLPNSNWSNNHFSLEEQMQQRATTLPDSNQSNNHFSLEEQMQQRATTLPNSNRSNNHFSLEEQMQQRATTLPDSNQSNNHFSLEEQMQQRATTLPNSNRSTNHFSLEEQMQQRAATLPISNLSNNDVFSPIMQQEPVADSAVYQRFLDRTPIDANVPGLLPQPYQQPTDDNGANDKLGLPRDVSKENIMGVAIEEVFSLKASQKKIFCCSFASNGDLLASAGDENKVFVWNLRSNLEQYTWEAHSSFITDISFGPHKTFLATASSDKTVRLWDISQGGHKNIQTFVGHSSLVRSVDFHPHPGASFLCSCDDAGKVLFWKIDQQGQRARRISEATGRGKVRFDPLGKCLASIIGNTVNVTDVDTDKRMSCMQGNGDNKTVQSVCWSEHYNCLACVSEDCVRVWPRQGGGPARELKGTKLSYYRSCSFHPRYPNTLVIGGYQTITLWDIAENKAVSVQQHGCHVSDLAGCRATGLLASASHDGCVKVWR